MTHYSILKWPAVLLAILISFNLAAQQPDNNIIASKKTSDGRFTFLKFNVTSNSQFRNAVQQPDDIKKIFGLGARHSFIPDELTNKIPGFARDAKGADHVRYKQYFNGVEVEYGVVTLHSKNGALNVLTGEYFNIDENFSTTPLLSSKAALDRALSFVRAKKYSWEDSSVTNKSLKSIPKGELIICRNYLEGNNAANAIPKMELAYKFAIYATEPLRYDYIYVSAATGNIIHVNPIIKHLNGTGATRYSGSKTLTTTQLSAGNYLLKDTSGTNYNIATYNLNRGTNYSNAPIFSDNDNNWTSAEYNNSNFDNAALDAHWGAMMTQDYWRTVHNRNSFDNKGSRINSYVHYGNLYSNAFWDGSVMTYGDGDGMSLSPFTSVDICGHEIGHAVCQYTANLIYSFESGAINEGFSDIWGACIKRFADPSKNTWLMGDEISSSGNPIRSMSDPKREGQPDTYKGVNWYVGGADNGGVHYNSGVMNHWFYILTEGKTGTNDKGTSYKVSGLGITKAAQIAYRAENLYLYPNAVYADTRIASIQAAEDLFGAGSNEVVQTTAAWNAVGVLDALARPDSVTAAISNNSVVIKWRFNSFQNITGFKIQRAINGTNVYATIAIVGAAERSFTDAAFVNNSINQYRISSLRDSLYSDYSDVASVAIGNAPFAMTNGTFTKCGVTFFDPGGQNNYNSGFYTTTVKPEGTGNKLKIVFSEFGLYNYDSLKIYNGPSSSSPLLGSFTGTTLPPVLESSAPGGELTFVFNASYYSSSTGWKAYISCFKAIAAATNLVAITDSLKNVRLTWADNANDEPGYVVERAVNDSVRFQPVANLPANTTSYKDSSAPDGYLFYRVKALGDSVSSAYSNIAPAKKGNLYAMGNQVLTTCDITFLDPGGPDNYKNGSYTTTFRPAVNGNKLKVVFSQFNVGYDYLYIYNGPSSSSPLLGTYYGTNLPPVLQSTAAGGELTFVFNGYNYGNAPGWTSYVSCYKPVAAPTNLSGKSNDTKNVQLSWIDNADDETAYVIERSLNDSLHFLSLITLPANTIVYNDTSVPANSFIFYRIKAYRDTVASLYSNTAPVFNGHQYVMQNGSYTTCDVTFLDPGGAGNYNNGSYTTTIHPGIAGNSLQVSFTQFNLYYNDYLYIYNGPSTSSPLLGSYSASNMPPNLKSTAPGGELTFVLYTYYSNNYPGWVAHVSCYKPVLKPTGLKAVTKGSDQIQLSWTDNADDETGYVIERSVNSESLFKTIGQVEANRTFFTDSTPPTNSQLYYRVKAYRDIANSLYSDTTIVPLGNAPFLMKDSVLVTCDKTFLDPGGEDIIPSFTSYSYKTTFKPAVPGSRVRVTFIKLNLNSSVYVYNGSSTASPFIGSLPSRNSNAQLTYEGTGPDGSLTFFFNSYTYSYRDSGWVAQVSCYKPVSRPTAVKASLNGAQRIEVNWNDNSDDETGYVVERSVNGLAQFKFVGLAAPNRTNYVDSTAPPNSLIYYRIKAVRDTASSYYSDSAMVLFGNAPFLMKDSTLVTCDKVFLDPDGAGIIPNSYYNHTVTFKPGIAGDNIRVAFSKFKIYGYLTIYNGSSTNSPQIGTYNYMSSSPGTINGTGPEGSLTFVYQGNPDSGWVAQVSCYKPVATPSDLLARENEAKQIKLTWQDNADNEEKYLIERSLNGTSQFNTVGEAPANTAEYIDTTAPTNNVLYYRVRGQHDSTSSFYSNTTSISIGNIPILMKDTTVITCDQAFMDPAGADNLGYNTYYNLKTTFKPSVHGNNIRVSFSQFKLDGYLYVYNGSSQTSPLIGYYSSNSNKPNVINASGPDGSLTFVYNAYSYNDSGWTAKVSCFKSVAKPTGLNTAFDGNKTVELRWTDNADDETRYVVERSVNAPSLFTVVADLPSNATNFTDSAAPDNSLIYYRVRAYRDTLGSIYSDTASVPVGNAPFLMQDSTIITCNKVFMDGGGVNIVTHGNYYTRTTFKPGIDGNNIRVTFSKLRISGTLDVYDGSSNAGRLIGRFSGVYPNSLVFDATGIDGSLTFYYQSYNEYDSGWLAHVSCYKPVAKPTGLKVVSQTVQQVKLLWTDNANDETKYVVERSVNGVSLFAPIAQLPSNSSQYIDSTPPANSKVYYRVKAYRDTLGSLYSNMDSVALGNIPFLMKDSTLITCSKEFMDPGGADVIPPSLWGSYNITSTFKPAVEGNKLKASFSKFKLSGTLYVYDGPSTSSPLLRSLSYYNVTAPFVLKASGTDGSLTFVYSGWSYSDSGWAAQISCYKPIAAPGNLIIDSTYSNDVRMRWMDNANNEASYVVERSVNDSLHYTKIATLPANTTSYIDTAAPDNSFVYYRVAAYIDSSSFEYSNQASVITGTPFVMRNATITTCGTVFLDPGGLGNHPAGSYIATVKPATAGNVVRVQFSELNIYGSLYIYNGPSTSSPLLGSYYNYNLPTVLQSSAAGGELTFLFDSYYSSNNPGWIAYLSCYKPVLKPSGITATTTTATKISITWKDNANDETRYVVERSVNAPSLYEPLATLPANSVQYIDSTVPANSLLYYRVRAYRDTAGSFYSDTAVVANGNAPFIMKDSTLITCDKIFMDPGGVNKVPSNISLTPRTTFKPAVAGNKISVAFSKIQLEGYMYVYNGSSQNSPQIGFLNRYSDPSSVFNSTADDGSLTFVYSGNSSYDSGWVAEVSCYKPVAKPSGMKAIADSSHKIKLTWTDNADDETKYVVERSVNAVSFFTPVAQLPSNAIQYTDSSAPANSLLYYRVKAYRDTLGSFYSDTASVAVGDAPFLMKDSTVITCDKMFMDPAGEDVIPVRNGTNVTTTFKPGIAGNKIRVAFSKFRLDGYLYVYNGSSTNSPSLGIYSGYYTLPPVLNSTAADGSLTFVFSASSYYRDSGWVAHVSCYKPVAKPTGLKAIADSLQKIRVTWTDNADNETKYVVERSVNAPSQYKIIAELRVNTTEYYDTTAPANSLIFYRVRAYQDSLVFVYSDTANVAIGNAPYLMSDSTLITCNKVFMDAGGTDVISGSNYSRRTTFKPEISGSKVRAHFTKLSFSGSLYVYDGSSSNSPLLATLNRYYADPSPVFTATGADGALTFVFNNGYSYYPDSGWVAQISCYKPVAKPSNLKAVADSANVVKLAWTDNADDETKYVVERSVNASSLYTSLANLEANTTEYSDSSAPSNSVLYYRVRAYRDTSGSIYSDPASVAIGNAPFLMKDSTLITCDKVFMDPGGVGVTQGYYTLRTTFKPATSGSSVKVAFSKINPNSPLYVFDGSSTSSPLLGLVSANGSRVFYSTAADGSLTFQYQSYGYSDSGWVAQVDCFKRVTAPTNLIASANNSKNVQLIWTDRATDETRYVVERSFNDSLNYVPLISLTANATGYTDTSATANSYVFYRVKAYRDSIASAYSNTVSVINGNVFVMRSGTINGCGITFLDPGGSGNYGNSAKYTTTFTSPETGKKIKVVFNTFATESCCDFLNVYNGPDTLSPLLGTYVASALPPVLQSSAPNGELTFVFNSDRSTTAPGWSANVSCTKSNDTLTICSTDSNLVNTIETNIIGLTYQWQKYNGKNFVNIHDDSNNSGTATSTLHIRNAGLSILETFRCLVNLQPSMEFVVVKVNRWIGGFSSDWNDAKNWSCETVPDANTDVLVEGGMLNNPVLNSDGECRSIRLNVGANLSIVAGYKLNIRH